MAASLDMIDLDRGTLIAHDTHSVVCRQNLGAQICGKSVPHIREIKRKEGDLIVVDDRGSHEVTNSSVPDDAAHVANILSTLPTETVAEGRVRGANG